MAEAQFLNTTYLMEDCNPIGNAKLLGLGCSTFGGSKSKKIALGALHTAFEKGITYFDVARSYGYGQAESIVGEFIAGKRGQVIITTKLGIAPPRPFPFMSQIKDGVRWAKRFAPGFTDTIIRSYSSSNVSRPAVTPDAAVASLERSLKELRTDYVDYFLMHDCPYQSVVSDDLRERLEKEKEKGKLRVWGATCENQEELPAFLSAKSPISVVQFPYSDSINFLENLASSDKSKVVFSVMSHRTDQVEQSPLFFGKLPINQISPGTVENLREAWLYIACQELASGVILCSMTQAHHIERNLKILEAPPISFFHLKWMKMAVKAGKLPMEVPGTPIPSSVAVGHPDYTGR